MSESILSPERLDSWKAIAAYLHRDLATVRRWEKTLGLPVRRVAGTGRSVFAYSAEIDRWLEARTATPAMPALPVSPAAPPAPTRAYPWRLVLLFVAILAVPAGFVGHARRLTADDLRVEATSAGVIARDRSGAERWRYQFPATDKTEVLPGSAQVTGGRDPGVYVATTHRARRAEDQVESGAVIFLDINGNQQRSFSFDDQVTFNGTPFGAPWAVSAFAVSEGAGPRRVAVSAHHYVWDPSLVTILDDRWQRHGTFVFAGWIEAVRWLGPDRLLIAGFSNAHDGGMIALLDAAALNGQGPEPPGGRYFCDTCGSDRPLRMFVFPRTEINRVTASPFNRVVVQTMNGRIVARTIEMPSNETAADVVYGLNGSFDLVSARFSERYWEIHRELEAERKITHTRDQCPDRDGPSQVQMWEPATGWHVVRIRSGP